MTISRVFDSIFKITCRVIKDTGIMGKQNARHFSFAFRKHPWPTEAIVLLQILSQDKNNFHQKKN